MYETNYRNIKYPRLEFRTGKLQLILPQKYKEETKLLEKHKRWILNKHNVIKEALAESKNKKIEERDFDELKRIVIKYSKNKKFGLNKIYFRKMKSKWASVSSRKNLTANSLLRYLPQELIKYVVYHELTHLKEKRHNENFWSAISKKFKDYEDKEKELFVYWFTIQNFIT